jgi:2-iminobutanoate/2-iminopropanoate deaminase
MTAKRLPDGATRFMTASPYSPVLEIDARQLVVLAGQVAMDAAGNVVGDDIEAQTRQTLENCRQRLEAAGCRFADVFKVNAYMADLSEWDRFNAVYAKIMPEPRPARTTVGAALMDGFRIEIEMWAVKPDPFERTGLVI